MIIKRKAGERTTGVFRSLKILYVEKPLACSFWSETKRETGREARSKNAITLGQKDKDGDTVRKWRPGTD